MTKLMHFNGRSLLCICFTKTKIIRESVFTCTRHVTRQQEFLPMIMTRITHFQIEVGDGDGSSVIIRGWSDFVKNICGFIFVVPLLLCSYTTR